MKAVIYAHYSSDNQREESIEGQLWECTAFAEKNGITILRHYIDRAYSAKTDNRTEFQHMLKDSSEHPSFFVLRFSAFLCPSRSFSPGPWFFPSAPFSRSSAPHSQQKYTLSCP